MTATHVNGLRVVFDEPAEADIKNKATGQPIQYHQVRHLLLEDGSEVYGCIKCDFTSTNKYAIRPHLNKHNRKPKQETVETPATNGAVTIDEVMNHLVSVKLIHDRGHDIVDVLTAIETIGAAGHSLPEVLRRLEAVDRIQAERDAWKKRGQNAERDLKKIRGALGLA